MLLLLMQKKYITTKTTQNLLPPESERKTKTHYASLENTYKSPRITKNNPFSASSSIRTGK